MLYQGSKSEDSWYFYINTMNDSTLHSTLQEIILRSMKTLTAETRLDGGCTCMDWVDNESLTTELTSNHTEEKGMRWQYGQPVE